MLQCPCCRNDLRAVIESGIEIDVCDQCDCVWLDAGEINLLAQRHKSKATLNLAEAVIRDHVANDLCCPRCEETDFCDLTIRGVQVSRCENCAGIYIDHDSLDRLRSDDTRNDTQNSKKVDGSTESKETGVAAHVAIDIVGNGLFELLFQLLFIA